MGSEVVDWIHLLQEKVQLLERDARVPQLAGKYVAS
jgi:hypothetical protein